MLEVFLVLVVWFDFWPFEYVYPTFVVSILS